MLLELAEIKHRRKETVKISTAREEKKNGHEKLSAEALHSAPVPDDVTPDAPKAAVSPPTATGGDYVDAADLILDTLTASAQADMDIQSS
ncbi:unnamed protein product [Cylicocyclus nassatus]|uniref:Uncharacterized protein n=1 Tax=Cylicocyclus nassatus TaxID=53992 RepID=A0AA36GSG4_CYLNA|nr:unnamed protein product [Cylicocyclus nassatus]